MSDDLDVQDVLNYLEVFNQDDKEEIESLFLFYFFLKIPREDFFIFLCRLVDFLHPGSGNYERAAGSNQLVSRVEGWSRIASLQTTLVDSTVSNILGLSIPSIRWLAEIVEPWISLPRWCSRGFFADGLKGCRWHSFQYYESQVTVYGRQYSQTPFDRFLHYFLWCKYGGVLTSRIEPTRYAFLFLFL